MRLYKDGEISSSGYSYVIIKFKVIIKIKVIIKTLVGERGGSWVYADIGCGASAGNIPYAAVLCGVSSW